MESFLQEYWEQQPLLVQREDPAYFAGVLTLADVDHILAYSSLNGRDLRLVAAGRETSVAELLPGTLEGKVNGLELVYSRYRAGATVNLTFLQERWPALATLCSRLAAELSASVHGNVYLTPPGTQGLTPHHDTHDVLVLQLHGTKRWQLFEAQTLLASPEQHYALPPGGAGEPVHDFVLRPGDLFYMPRGTVHAATANEDASLHLTIGISPMLWVDVLRAALTAAASRDIRLRQGLPPGFAGGPERQEAAASVLRERIAQFTAELDAAGLIADAASRMLQRRPPALDGHLLDLAAAASVSSQTRLRTRDSLQFRLTRDGDELNLEFHGKTIGLPEYIEDELAFITKAGEFCAADVPGGLDEPGRLLLVRQLLQEGFLTLA